MTKYILILSPLALCGCAALSEFMATPEGGEAVNNTLSGAAGVAVNPANVFAWYDLVMGVGALALGGAGLVGGGKALKVAGGAVKKHVLNKPQDV